MKTRLITCAYLDSVEETLQEIPGTNLILEVTLSKNKIAVLWHYNFEHLGKATLKPCGSAGDDHPATVEH